MERATRGGGRRLHPSATAAMLAALTLCYSGPVQAAAPADGAAAGPAHVIAAVERGRTPRLHAAPGGPPVDVLDDRTPFGSPTRLAVLARRDGWLAVSSEVLDNGHRAWIKQSDAVRLSRTRYMVVVSLRARRLELRAGSRTLLRAAVAIGRPNSPTPTGRFGITDKLAGARFGRSYGCCVLVLSTVQTHLPRRWKGDNRVALHGTSAPASLGRASSAGCLRLDDRPLRALMRRLPLGAPVVIRR